MHGKKRFIIVRGVYDNARWYDHVSASAKPRMDGTRLKRSHHRTTVDIYLVPETEVKWIGRRFGAAGPPRWWRKVLNRKYRAKTANLMRSARYDDLFLPKRDGSWFW